VGELVECRSDSEYAERPLALVWQGERLEIVEILASWRAPVGKGFRMVTQNSQTFELLYFQPEDTWSVHPV